MDENNVNKIETGSKNSNSKNNLFSWLFLLFTVVSISIGVLWVVWLCQGKPDTWYGNLFSFQYQAISWIVLIGVCIAVLFVVIIGLTVLIEKIKSRKEG